MTDADVYVELRKDRKVLRGKNGRLFVIRSNSVLSQHAGELLLGDRQLERWRLVLERRAARLAERDAGYFFLVPPNAHSVYPEDLPDEVPPLAPIRPITQLIGHLEARSHFQVTYPLDALVAAKREGQLVYPKTNSHWSSLGAFVAYRLLATAMAPVVKLNRLEWEDVRFEEDIAIGDLGFKVEPEEASTRVSATVERPRARLVSDNRVVGSGTLVITECEQAPATTCLVFGDSFAHKLLPFFAASFRRMVFAQLAFMDEGLVDAEEPDVVITVLNERYLIRTPNDGPSRSLDQVVQSKPPDVRVRPAMPFWEERTSR